MAILMFNPGVNELLSNSGEIYEVPQEVIDQADDSEMLEFAARWAFKANLIDRSELSETIARRA